MILPVKPIEIPWPKAAGSLRLCGQYALFSTALASLRITLTLTLIPFIMQEDNYTICH